MATTLEVVEKTLEDLEKEITCAVCQEHYTDPKILPCLHCYCKQCIMKLSLRVGKGKPFPCPECRKDTVFPDKEEELKSAFIINRLKSMYLKHKKALSKQASCEICNKTEALAEAFCRQCDKFACKDCVHLHSLMKGLFDGHECVPIEKLQKIRSEELVQKYPEPKKCGIHGEQLKIFCFDCNKLICRDCTVKDHRDHNIEFNKVAADNNKKELMETLKPLKEVEKSLSLALTKVAKVESEIQAQEKAATNKIEAAFEELHKVLEMRKKQLLEELKKINEDKVENLTVQKKKLSIANGKVRSVIDHTEQCVRVCSDDEVMSMHSEISSRILTQIKQCNEQENSQELSKDADMIVEVDSTEALKEFCQENIWIGRSKMFQLEVEESDNTINGEVKFKLLNKLNQIVPRQSLKCQYRSVSSGTVAVANVEHAKIGPNFYYVVYIPKHRDLFEIEISAYGKSVPGSPFNVPSFRNPSTFDKPMKVVNKLSASSFGVAVNSQGEILVVEYNKNIVLFDSKWNIIKTVNQSNFFNSLCGVAVDHEDNVYIIGGFVSRLGKCDHNFHNIQVRDVKQVQGCGHIDIAVVADEVLVTENNNNGQITIYDRELNFVRRMSTGQKTVLRYLCTDSHDNLYVSTGYKIGTGHKIVVIDKFGVILHSFNPNQVLQDPWMVHVHDRYVFVGDLNLKKTVVFTTEGEYVTTFGYYGPLCVDKRGVVYNFDYTSGCIYIY